jgi:uncharacterized protein YutE (UPF0331/DUF86 family)
MTPLNKFQKESIIRRIDFLKKEFDELENFSNYDYKDYQKNTKERKILERTIENILNCMIDISKIILVGEKTGIPKTYAETLSKLSLINIVSEKEAKVLSESAKLRNILFHEYLDILWKEIKNFMKNRKVIKTFIAKVEKLVLEK